MTTMAFDSCGTIWPNTWFRPKAIHDGNAVPSVVSSSASSARLCIINALLGITATIVATIALGSITAAALPALVVSAAQSTTNRPAGLHHHHNPGNYQGVDAVSALTGLSNGYMPGYYQQLRNAREYQHPSQHQHQHPHQQSLSAHQPEEVDKEPTGRGMQLHANNHYGNAVVGGSGISNPAAVTSPETLDIFNVPDSGFIPTTLSAAGQHYASSFLGLQSVADKMNAHGPAAMVTSLSSSPPSAASTGTSATDKLDLQQSASTTAYASMTAASNNGATSLYERLSNYDEESMSGDGNAEGRSSSSTNLVMASGGDGASSRGQNFVPVYGNYAANLYNDPSTNEGEQQQQQSFANYFTPTTSAHGSGSGMMLATTSSHSYGGSENPHKYLPLNNYYNAEQHHYQQQSDKQNIYSRALAPAPTSSPVTTSTTSTNQPSGLRDTSSVEYYANYNYPHNNEDSYPIWNLLDKQLSDNYYASPEHPHPSGQELQVRQYQQDENVDYKEPEPAESSYVPRTREKRGKNKSKRSDPLHDTYDSYSTSDQSELQHTTGEDDAETIQIQQQQLEELHKQLHQQQQQFITLQHQLIDHDQQLQIQKHHAQYNHAAPAHTLPPVSQTVHHNTHSLQALSGTPLSKHTHIVRSIPVPHLQQVYVPTKQNVNVEVPDPIITTVSKPIPIEVPVSKTIAVPHVKEVKIPIERVKPFPVERPIPYLVEKRVPYTVEKQVAQPVYYHVPIKVPIVHTVIHKLHSPHAYSYQNQQHYPTHPIRYTGHIRHPAHHGHSHYRGSGVYRK